MYFYKDIDKPFIIFIFNMFLIICGNRAMYCSSYFSFLISIIHLLFLFDVCPERLGIHMQVGFFFSIFHFVT